MINLSLNKKILLFGFIFTFFSSFGQSFFLGLFNPSIRNELEISHGQFGTIYAIATICSSIVLIWFGKKIDEYKLLNYSIIVIGILFFKKSNGPKNHSLRKIKERPLIKKTIPKINEATLHIL